MGATKKGGERYACGKLRTETPPPAIVRRVIDEAKRGVGNPLFGTELGRLRLNDVITDKMVSAGNLYAEVCGIYDRLKGMPSRHAKSPSYEMGYGKSASIDREDEQIIADLRRTGGDVREAARRSPRLRAILKAVERFERAESVLKSEGGVVVLTVKAVVLDDEMVVSGRHPHLKLGLMVLHDHFHLTGAWR